MFSLSILFFSPPLNAKKKTKKKRERDACERDKKERPLVASYQFTRCL